MLINEIKKLVKLAMPVSLAQLAVMGMGATDVLIAGQAGTLELAGMSLGSNIWHLVILFFMGIGLATQLLIARRFGARDYHGVKHQFQQAVWMCLVLGVAGSVCLWLVTWAMSFTSFDVAIRAIAQEFLLVISFAALPMCLLPAARGTLEGISLTATVFWVNLAAFLLNIPLDFALVHGLWGLPKLGGVGCAWATVVLVWAMFLSLCVVIQRHRVTAPMRLFADFAKPHKDTIKNTFKLGLPIGMSIAIELSMFSGAGILIAYFGAVQAGAHAVAITIVSLSFMFYMGLGQGLTIRAAQLLGADNLAAAWYTIKAGTAFNLSLAGLFCVLFLLFKQQFVTLISDDPLVIDLAVDLVIIGAAFQLADCLQVTAICALRAYQHTTSPPKYQVLSFWVLGLPLGIGLAFYQWWPGLEGALGMWVAMLASLTLVGLLSLYRLRKLVAAYQHF